MTKSPTSFDPQLFPPVLAALKQSLSGVDKIRKRGLDIENMTLDPGPMKNNYYPVDVTYKGLIRDMTGLPEAFILCANPVGKNLVRENVEKAKAARDLLPPPHNRIIDLPFLSGDVQGVSWAIYDLNIPLSQGRWTWQMQKRLLTPAVGTWITNMLETTKQPISHTDLSPMIIDPLESLCRENAFSNEMHKSAATALNRAETGAWKPFTCLAHNDLWRGNIMRPPGTPVFTKRFRVIDWAGSELHGIPFFDIFKFLQSFTVPREYGRELIQAHCNTLQCSPTDVTGYLLTALGVLGQNLNQFPHQAYVNLAKGLYTLHHTY